MNADGFLGSDEKVGEHLDHREEGEEDDAVGKKGKSNRADVAKPDKGSTWLRKFFSEEAIDQVSLDVDY